MPFDMSQISRAVRTAAAREWNDPGSLSNAVAASVPEDAREGFVVLADFSGVCVLDPRGVFRAFEHDGRAEVEQLRSSIRRSALLRLSETYPELAQLLVSSGVHSINDESPAGASVAGQANSCAPRPPPSDSVVGQGSDSCGRGSPGTR